MCVYITQREGTASGTIYILAHEEPRIRISKPFFQGEGLPVGGRRIRTGESEASDYIKGPIGKRSPFGPRNPRVIIEQLVTGDRKTIYANARTSYFADQEAGVKEKNGIMHTESVILRDPEGHIRGVYNGTLRLDMKRMIADIRVLKKELEATD
tara:strand:+ start:1466 stop:1927 length:462 start_codon:yes stop_codon:yes gene_type:complete